MAARRQLILEEVRRRLRTIVQGEGDPAFQTSAGKHVYLGELPVLGPDDADTAICITVGDETPSFQGENVASELPVEIHALSRADLDEPWIAVEEVLADIKRAMEVDRTLGGLVKQKQFSRGQARTMEREAGSTVVGATILYFVPIVERWGRP